ncbi:MAG: hypothetical protein OEX22_11880, partial [Cyclobacteriaceae bacterium]|nr:hypothetical protein [Cyclobacteriaceae bacterium]
PLFWERLIANVPSVISETVSILCCADLLLRNRGGEEEKEIWIEEVLTQANKYNVVLNNGIECVDKINDINSILSNSECVIFSHNILNALSDKKLLDQINGSMISFDRNFEVVERCVVVFDKSVKSIENFKKFFNHFAQTMKNSEVVLLIEIGKTLAEASKNKKAVKFMIGLFKNVGVVTCPAKDLQNEIQRYLSRKENSVLIFHKEKNEFIFEPKFKENVESHKIAYYLDEF